MAEKAGPPRVLKRRHILKLSPEMDEQLDRWLDLQEKKLLIEPVTATLSNPTAFPILFAGVGLLIGVLILRAIYPETPETSFPIAQVRDTANDIARWIKEHDPGFLPATESALDTAARVLGELLVKIWKGITQLPPIL